MTETGVKIPNGLVNFISPISSKRRWFYIDNVYSPPDYCSLESFSSEHYSLVIPEEFL